MGTLNIAIIFGIIFGILFGVGLVFMFVYYSNQVNDDESIPKKPQYAQEEFLEKQNEFRVVAPFIFDQPRE